MKKFFHRWAAVLSTLTLLLALAAQPAAGASFPVEDGERLLTVLFTHDTHDHFYPDASGVGGYTRLATLLRRERGNSSGAVVTVDGGDFSMGSLFQTVYSTDAPELRALGAMDYDVVTFGNHEFDYRPQGLADMLNAAKEAEEAWHNAMVMSYTGYMDEYLAEYGAPCGNLPSIVQANYKTPKDPGDPASQALVKAMADYPVTDYTVLEREGLKIAVFGIMGVDSDECAPMSGMELEDPIAAAKRVVAEIQEKESPDFILCLSHSGTEKGRGEDYELAKKVDGIDVIISGHTHTTLEEPIEVNGTLIVSCGPYTQNLGKLVLSKGRGESRATLKDYALFPLDGSVEEDEEMTALAEVFKAKVDESYLSRYGLGYDQALATAKQDFTKAETGDFIGESYIATVQELEGADYVPIAFAVAPDGVIRGSIKQGAVTTAQAFDILSLGSGADGSPGYPLVSVYLTGKDLKNTFEVDASISDIMGAAELYGAGCYWEYNPRRMFLNRVVSSGLVSDVKAEKTEGGYSIGYRADEIDDDKLYRVVADLYSGQMLAAVKAKSFGLLSITPRDENGNEVTDFESRILHDEDGNEVKAWYAFAHHLEETGEVDSGLVVKSKYKLAGTLADELWPVGVLVVVLLPILAVVLIIRKLLRRRRRGNGFAPPYRGR